MRVCRLPRLLIAGFMADYTQGGAEVLAAAGENVSTAWVWQVNVGGPMTQYQCGPTWIDFNSSLCTNLETAYQAVQPHMRYEFQNTHYEIDMAMATQRNMSSGTVRDIRRVFVSHRWPMPNIAEAVPSDRRSRAAPNRSGSRAPSRSSWGS